MKKQKSIAVAGHICLDITPVFPESSPRELSRLLAPGKLVKMEGIRLHTGGCVANTGLALSRLGNSVTLLGKVGNDDFGRLVLDSLRREGLDAGMLVSEECGTSYSVVLSPPGIDRIFLHDPGANDVFVSGDISEEQIPENGLFHFGYPTIMRRMFLENGRELREVLQKAKRRGALTSLDLAAADPASEAGKADWNAILGNALPQVDFFLPSAEELAFLIDRELYLRWSQRNPGGDLTEAIDPAEELPRLGRKALELGAKVVLIKCGARGLYLQTGNDVPGPEFRDWAERSVFFESYRPRRVISGAGAGDVCIAGFLTGIAEGAGWLRCLQLAAGAGAARVEACGDLGGRRELEARIDGGWEKQPQELSRGTYHPEAGYWEL